MADIKVQRVYDADEDDSSYRVLVDRLWPRGVAKDEMRYDEWAKQVAPSKELRQAFHADEYDFADFAEAYRAELDASDEPRKVLTRAGERRIVLLYAAKNRTENHAVVLRDYLRELRG